MGFKIPVRSVGERKLTELILYISKLCSNDPNFGSTKLNKILYFSDFLAYGKLGKAITGVAYQHLEKGPAPKMLLPVRTRMIERGDLRLDPHMTAFGYEQKRPIPLRDADLDLFEVKELNLVNDIMAALSRANATEASNISHREVGWKTTKMRETIPYASIFLSDEPLSHAEVSFGQAKWAEMTSANNNRKQSTSKAISAV
ncbi:MAG: Panacea domain-containing protein [Terracidiphilus sp.]